MRKAGRRRTSDKTRGAEAQAENSVPAGLSHEEIRAQLERILSSESFRRSERLSRFLRYVVEQALAGKTGELKEYSIAVEVFDKRQDFETRADPIVRVEAGRLRAKIREYYATEGREDAVFLGLRDRGYRPVFQLRRKNRKEKEKAKPVETAAEAASSPARRQAGKRTPPAAEPSLAILPFADLSLQRTQEYFCDALTQQLINELARIEGLRVVGRTSTSRFKNKAEDLRAIGDDLKVWAVLEGSVQQVEKRVRVSVQLINASNGLDLWAETYDRPLEDIFEVQDEICRAVVRDLSTTLLGGKEKQPAARDRQTHAPASLDAYNEYLKGVYHGNQPSEDELQTGIGCFERAIEADPAYAPAYAGLAGGYVLAGLSGILPSREVAAKAKAAALRALELDAKVAKAHAALGVAQGLYEWDWGAAELRFRRALELHGDSATAHHWYAIGYLTPQGRLEEAIEEMQRARELNPSSVLANTHLGLVYYLLRYYEEALAQFNLSLELAPEFSKAHWGAGRAHLQECRMPEAVAAFEKAHECSGGRFRPGSLGHGYAAAGQREKSLELLRKLEKAPDASYEIAEIHLGLDEAERALDCLERAREERSPWLSWLGVDPIFDPIRSESRFGSLVRELGLGSGPQPQAASALTPAG